jgi:hypothetical protein
MKAHRLVPAASAWERDSPTLRVAGVPFRAVFSPRRSRIHVPFPRETTQHEGGWKNHPRVGMN